MNVSASKKPVQFDWRRHWKKKVEPYLKHELVQYALDFGMRMLDESWQRGDPPHRLGRQGGREPVEGRLAWYQPRGRCHWIAFFSMAIGVLNYPDLNWRFVGGDLHTVPVGFDDAGEPRVVMDILLFDKLTAAESIGWAREQADGPRKARVAAVWAPLYERFEVWGVPRIRWVGWAEDDKRKTSTRAKRKRGGGVGLDKRLCHAD